MVIEPEVWEQNPERPTGYLRVVRTKTVREVYEELCAALDVGPMREPVGAEEYFSPALASDGPWPEGRIAVFVVTGGSEGLYTHVEVLEDGSSQCVLLGKTLDDSSAGRDAAWAFARRVADLLGA